MKSHRVSKSSLSPETNPSPYHNPASSLIELEKRVRAKFKKQNIQEENFFYVKIINEIINNEGTHIVAEFKDYLIHGDMTEFLTKYYPMVECRNNLEKIFEYYESCSVIFPNYVILPESRYIYKNIQKKQKVIDIQQQLEQDLENKKNDSDNLYNDDDSNKVFETKVFDSLLNQTTTSVIHQLLGVPLQNDLNLNSNSGSAHSNNHNKSIEELISHINTAEVNLQPLSDRNPRCTLKKESVSINMKYANCTTTTKDKSTNGPYQPSKKKTIISNIIPSDKDLLIRAMKDMNYRSVRPSSNDNSSNASHYRDNNTKKRISSSSSKNTLINSQRITKANTSHVKNVVSMQKLASTPHNPPLTSRDNKNNTDIIQLLTSKILRMKPIPHKASITHFRKQQMQFKKTMSSLSTVTSSLTQKASIVNSQHLKEKTYTNLYDKYEKSPKLKKSINSIAPNRNRNELAGNNQSNSIKNNNLLSHEFSLSPSRQIDPAKTCTHLQSSNSFNKDHHKKKISHAVIPRKEISIKGIHIKGFDNIVNKNVSRNSKSISDRASNKNKSSINRLMN